MYLSIKFEVYRDGGLFLLKLVKPFSFKNQTIPGKNFEK